jgi:hypothetical protein
MFKIKKAVSNYFKNNFVCALTRTQIIAFCCILFQDGQHRHATGDETLAVPWACVCSHTTEENPVQVSRLTAPHYKFCHQDQETRPDVKESA